MIRCNAPSAPSPATGESLHCELESGHEGQHAWTDRDEARDGRDHTYRWGRGSAKPRTRRQKLFTLGDAARARLTQLATRTGLPESRVVEDLILRAAMPRARG